MYNVISPVGEVAPSPQHMEAVATSLACAVIDQALGLSTVDS